MDLGVRRQKLQAATQQMNRMRGTAKTNPAGFRQQLANLNRQRALMDSAIKANAAPGVPALPPVTGGLDLPEFMGGGGGGSHRSARAPKDQTAQNEGQFADMLARLNDELLSAKRDNLVDVGQIADINRQQVGIETNKLNADITELAAKNPIIKANEDKLRGLVAEAAAQHQLSISTEELERRSAELLSVQLATNDNQRDVLQAMGGLATTAGERRDIALRLLSLDEQEERLRQEDIIASKTATDAQKQIAQRRLATIDQMHGLRVDSAMRQTEGPLEAYIRDANKTGAQMNEAVQGIAVNGITTLTDGLADAIVNFKSLGDVAKNVLAQIAADLLRLQLQKAISGLIGNVLGGIGGGGGLGKQGLKLGMRANGGPVDAGTPYIVGEKRPELFVPRVPGVILPRVPQVQSARNDNGAPVTINVHPHPGMSGRDARETGAQAYRGFREEQARFRRIGA